jgi:uncharacterized protein YfaS (alpha-2-macroglobulin family)
MKNTILFLFTALLLACSQDQADPEKNTSAVDNNPVITANTVKSFNKPIKTDRVFSELTQFKILSITESLYENAPALQLNLTLPIDSNQDVNALISVMGGNDASQKMSGGWIYADGHTSLYFPFIEAETHYRVIVDKDLLAFNGKKLSKGLVKEIDTRPFQKKVRFTSRGSTLMKDSNVLPIEAVNVDAVDMKFWRIDSDKYAKFLQMSYLNEIYSLERMDKIAKVVYTAQFDLDMIKNKREKHNISLKNIAPLQQAGLYFVTMLPHDKYSYKIESTWFVNTDIGIHSRYYPQSLVIFTHKIPQAQTYADVTIKLLDNDGTVLATTKTDDQGFAEFKDVDLTKAMLVIAQVGENFNIIRLNKAKMDLSEFGLASRTYHSQELFLYAPRDLYRPGETVNINGLLRNHDGEFVQASPIKVEIRRADNRLFKSFSWQGDKNSLYSSEFLLPKDALTGRWSFVATLANKDQFTYTFSVEDFLPERLKLELQSFAKKQHLSSQDQVKINIHSDYLYGAPASNNRFDANVTVSTQTRLFDQYKNYVFGANKYRDYNINYNIPMAKLDENGSKQLTLENKWQQSQFPLSVRTHVNVYESGGRPISRKIVQTIWPHTVAIGVRPSWLEDDGQYASPNVDNQVDLIAINKGGERIDLNNVEVLLVRENHQRYWQWGDAGWNYNQSNNNVPVFATVVNLSKDKITAVSLPLEYGNYRLEVRDSTQVLISSYSFFSGWRWYDNNRQRGEKPDQVKLEWLADTIKPDTEAQLKVTAPYAGLALLTIESDKLLWKKSFTMTTAQSTIAIAIDKDWQRHDLHATVMVIRQGDSGRKHLPARSFGVIHLPLDRTTRKLAIAIQNPEKALPESTVTIKIKASNINHKQATFLTLAAVDTGVLNVSNFKTPKPHQWFFAARKYVAEIRDMYASIIAFGDGKNSRQKFGGDADINRGGDAPQSEVQIISLFSQKVAFNAQGMAEVKLDLPYFNGELRLMAMAFNDNQFAGVDAYMKVAAPIIVSTSMPRFLAKGDRSFATIDVHNSEDTAQTVQLEITADKALGSTKKQLNFELASQQKRIIKLPIEAKFYRGIGTIHVNADIASNGYHLQHDWKIDIRPAHPAVTRVQTSVLEAGASFSPNSTALNDFDDNTLKSVLKVSNRPVLNAEDYLHHLIQYPYGCLEQTSSRAWPLLMAEATDFSLFDSEQSQKIFSQRHQLIDSAISRILTLQRYDGSFGLWNNASKEEKWLSVYVTDFLLQAKSAGYAFSDKALNKAIKRLGVYVNARQRVGSDLSRYLTDREHYVLAFQAYAAYVLAGIKKVSLQDVRKLYDKTAKNAKTGLPLAHLALALELLGDERRASEAWLKAMDFKALDNTYRYYGDYGSNIRDLSQVILLSTQSHIAAKLPKSTYQLLTPLQNQLKSKQWLSTQERGSLFRLAKGLESFAGANDAWQLELQRNNQLDAYKQQQDFIKIWYEKSAKQPFKVVNTHEKPLFIDYKTQGFLTETKAVSNGISIKRRYFNTKGQEISIKKLKTGDMILVHLQVSLDKKFNYLPNAMIIELLPAGLELENQNLEHALKIDELKLETKRLDQWQTNNHINHTEYRDDRFVSALSLSRYNPSHVFYLARAVTPGEFEVPATLVEDMYQPEIRGLGPSIGKMVIEE